MSVCGCEQELGDSSWCETRLGEDEARGLLCDRVRCASGDGPKLKNERVSRCDVRTVLHLEEIERVSDKVLVIGAPIYVEGVCSD